MCENPTKLIVNGEEIKAKCGKCDTCIREKYMKWAIKLQKEAEYHKKACFITLTFDNKILRDKKSKACKMGAHCGFVFNISESMEYFKKFIKRLRKEFKNKSISYYHVAEYGEKTLRPHHHAIIYGINFDEDRKEAEVSKSGKPQFQSDTLDRLWACGRCRVQDLNPNNIIYISQYTVKKYKNEILNKKYKAKMTFSNRKKMNVKWIRRNYNEIKKGYLTDSDGKKYAIPDSYLKTLKNEKIGSDMKNAYEAYEEKLMERFLNNTTNDLIKKQKIKSEIRRMTMKDTLKTRDF